MMRLSTLLKVDSTIEPEGGSPIADRILERWDHDPGGARFFRSSANFLYTFRRDGETCFLRFAHESERTRASVARDNILVEELSRAGIRVAAPLRARSGATVESVATPLGTFHAVALPALRGEIRDLDELRARDFWRWGAALAQLHLALAGLPDEVIGERQAWTAELAQALASIPRPLASVIDEGERLIKSAAALPVSSELFGAVHLDFETDNVVWRQDSIGILDFDDCSLAWYAADIVLALRDLFDAHFVLEDPRVADFVDGYSSVRAFRARELSAGDVFLRIGRLIQYARLRRALDIDADAAQPDWFRGLHGKLLSRVHDYEARLEDPAAHS